MSLKYWKTLKTMKRRWRNSQSPYIPNIAAAGDGKKPRAAEAQR
jgi:hypothetical protein